jgi:hypothetical protein
MDIYTATEARSCFVCLHHQLLYSAHHLGCLLPSQSSRIKPKMATHLMYLELLSAFNPKAY